MGTPVRIENAVICYPHLWTPHAPPGTERTTYSAEFILDPVANKPTLDALFAAFKQAATEAGKGALLAQLKSPIRPGAQINAERMSKGKEARPELEGKYVVRGSDPTTAPVVVDQQRRPIGAEQQGNLFGGCIVNAFVDLYWSSNAQNPGVFVGLKGVQLVSNVNVTRIGGGSLDADAMFDVVGGEIPFGNTSDALPDWA